MRVTAILSAYPDGTVVAVVPALPGCMGEGMGAEATIVGLQPAVAITLVELGVPMGHVRTALNAEQGMARLRGSPDEPDY